MKVFVSDAAGYNGESVVKALAAKGHKVTGLVRNKAEAEIVKNAGGKPVIGDAMKSGKWCEEVKAADKVISLVEPYEIIDGIPTQTDKATKRYGESVINLIKTAAEGKPRAILLTYSTTCFGHRSGKWVEGEPGALIPTGLCRPTAEWLDAIEDAANASGKDVVRLFPGLIYGETGWLATVANQFAHGNSVTVMPKDAWLNLIHIDDFAAIVAGIVDSFEGAESFILTDDRPVTQENLMAYIADLLDASCPVDVDKDEYTNLFGELLGETMVSSVRASSAQTLDMLQYEMQMKSYEHGIPETLRAMGYTLRETALGGEREEEAA